MVTFAEIVKTIDHLSEDETEELRAILRKKKEQEILQASKVAMMEYEEGKTISVNSQEEIIAFFKNQDKDDNSFQ